VGVWLWIFEILFWVLDGLVYESLSHSRPFPPQYPPSLPVCQVPFNDPPPQKLLLSLVQSQLTLVILPKRRISSKPRRSKTMARRLPKLQTKSPETDAQIRRRGLGVVSRHQQHGSWIVGGLDLLAGLLWIYSWCLHGFIRGVFHGYSVGVMSGYQWILYWTGP
jgi:hypothetical protein